MNTVLTASAPPRPLGSRTSQLLPVALIGALCAVVSLATTVPALVQAGMAVSVTVLLCVRCLWSPASAVVWVMAWLSVLAMIRRLLDSAGFGATSSPLLLVAPMAVLVLVAVAAARGAFASRTRLSNAVLLLTLLVAASAVNPLQGGVTVGFAGLLFVLVPMLWFWIGRTVIDDRTLTRLLRMISLLAIPAALYGLLQVYRGFPSWDAQWIENKGYIALRVGDSLRQFASFASTSEYVTFLGVGVLVWALKLRRAGGFVPAVFALTILGWALALASARAILVALPVALGVVFAASRGFGYAKSLVLGVGGLLALGAIVSTVDSGSIGGARTSELLSRQVEGLSDPFNSEVSTLPIHIEQVFGGLSLAMRNPIGQGVGSVTIAAERFGGETVSTESDPSNIAVATGIPGLLAYCFVAASGFSLAFRTARKERNLLCLVALGILVVTALQWLNGGTYSVAPLPWLMLGWLDRRSRIDSSAAGLAQSEHV